MNEAVPPFVFRLVLLVPYGPMGHGKLNSVPPVCLLELSACLWISVCVPGFCGATFCWPLVLHHRFVLELF